MNDLSAWRDEELLALVARRHEPALGALYDRYGRVVFAIGMRITGLPLVNAIAKVCAAEPGIRTYGDLPLVSTSLAARRRGT